MISYLEYLNAPAKIGCAVIVCFAVMQIIGEILEFKGKIVPECMKIRKIFSRRKSDREEYRSMMSRVEKQLSEVNSHYSADNIAKRDSWMQMVNDRNAAYDKSIVAINKSLSDVTQALNANTALTEEMFVQSSRDRIIDFASKVADENAMVSREEFNRIFKILIPHLHSVHYCNCSANKHPHNRRIYGTIREFESVQFLASPTGVPTRKCRDFLSHYFGQLLRYIGGFYTKSKSMPENSMDTVQ